MSRRVTICAGDMLPDPRVAPTLSGVVVYRKGEGGYTPIRWDEQYPGDLVLRIDWHRGRIQSVAHYRVRLAPDVSDPAMPVQGEAVSLEIA